MSTENNTPPPSPPQGEGLATAHDEDAPIGNTQGEESGSNDDLEGGASLGEDEHMGGDKVSDAGATVDEGEFDNGTGLGGYQDAELSTAESEEQKLTVAQRIRPVTAGWIKLNGEYDDGETFFPLPLITFGIDSPRNITCRLCRVSELRLLPAGVPRGVPQPPPTDNMPAIMPCGHVAGAVCLATEMEGAERGAWFCPFCRLHLVYPECGHRIKERVLTARTISALPPTLPMGGRLPPLCPACQDDALQVNTNIVLNLNMHEFKQAREMYSGEPEEDTAVYMLEKAEQVREICGNAIEEDMKIDVGFRAW